MLEISLYDLHLGRLAWAEETGHDNYDTKTAKELYVAAVKDLVHKARGYDLDYILLVVGQDFLNVDNEENTTTAGTPQHNDSRLGKIIDTSIEALHLSIAEILKYAKCKILFVPGNHDKVLTKMICKILEAYYHNDERISFDIGHTQRKYIQYGKTGIMFTHGKEEKRDKLPLIFAGEAKQIWCDTDHHEIHTGHLHTKKSYQYNSGDSIVGVTVRVLGSLSGICEWSSSKGYVNTPRIGEAFLYDYENGPIGEFIFNYKT